MDEGQNTGRDQNRWIVLLAAVLILCLGFLAQQLILLNGHDYGLALTRLLDTHFAVIKQGVGLYEYSPAFCGGIFNFANPNSGSLSLTQLLVSLVGPVFGIKLLYVLASLVGALGIFWCARLADLSNSAAFITASCFALSGVFATKVVVGHLLYYHLMLAPLVAAFLLNSARGLRRGAYFAPVVFACAAAAVTSLSIYGGVAGFLLPFMASILLIWLMCGGLRHRSVKPLCMFAAYLALSAALSAPKIEASLALFSNIGSRDFYSLPGFDAGGVLAYILSALFLVPNADRINDTMWNAEWYMGWHEIYVGLPTFALAVAVIWALVRPGALKLFAVSQFGRLGSFGILVVLLVPLLLNYYSPAWHRFLESLPILGDSSNMLRWSCIYVPAFAIAMGRVFNELDILSPRPAIAMIAMMIVTTWWQYSTVGTNLVAKENFNPSEILAQWHSDPERVPPVRFVGLATDDDGKGGRRAIHAPQYDRMFTQGVSNATCYEPVFGYRLESFPIGSIRSGDVAVLQNGSYGMINPACYVYPRENNCVPGSRFTAAQKDQMLLFVQRKPFGAKVSSARELSNLLAAGLWSLIVVLWAAYIAIRVRQGRQPAASE